MPDGGGKTIGHTAGEKTETESPKAGEGKTGGKGKKDGVTVVWARDRENPEEDIAISWTRRGSRLELNASMEMGTAPYETFLTLVNAVLQGARNGGFPDGTHGNPPPYAGTPPEIAPAPEEQRE